MPVIRRSALPLMVVLAACASPRPVGSPSPDGSAGATAAALRPARWTGSFRQQFMRPTAVIGGGTMASGAQASSFGSVTLTATGGERPRLLYDVSVSAPPAAGSQLAWALFTGPCNTPSPPVVAPSQLPVLDIDSNGRGLARGEVGAALDPRTTYHLNVYTTGRVTDRDNVLMCAKLDYNGPRVD